MPFHLAQKLQTPAIKQAIIIVVTIASLLPAITSLILSTTQLLFPIAIPQSGNRPPLLESYRDRR